MMRTRTRTNGTAVMPIEVISRKVISAMKAPIMKMSPWAKFIMPMMP